jgi:hypothetical protein
MGWYHNAVSCFLHREYDNYYSTTVVRNTTNESFSLRPAHRNHNTEVMHIKNVDPIVILGIRFDLSEVGVFLTAENVRLVENSIMHVCTLYIHCISVSSLSILYTVQQYTKRTVQLVPELIFWNLQVLEYSEYLLEHSLSSVHPRVLFNFFEKSILYGGVYHKNGGYKFVPFSYTGYKFIKFVPRVRRGVHFTVSTWSVVMSQFLVWSLRCTTVQLTSWKGGPLRPLIPFLPQNVNIPSTQSKADEHKKHDKQKRDEKDQGIHEMSFQAPKQNSYTHSWDCLYAVDQISKQHTCTIPINTRFLSLSFSVKPPLIVTSSSRSRSVNFHEEGTSRVDSQQSVSIVKKNVILQQQVFVFKKAQISVFQGRETVIPSNQ